MFYMFKDNAFFILVLYLFLLNKIENIKLLLR